MTSQPSADDFTSTTDAPSTDAPSTDASSFDASSADASSAESQWAINRRSNNAESPLCRLPNELLLKIMKAASEDQVTIYMLRQACHCFADLFSSPVFEYFHERDFSLILGRNKEKVKLDGLPLTAFRARVIDEAFSGHKRYARQLLRRDSVPEMVETTCPDTEDVRLEKRNMGDLVLCNYCATEPRPEKNVHPRDEFPPSQQKLSNEDWKACDIWFGYLNACSHCDHRGQHIQRNRMDHFDIVRHSHDRYRGGVHDNSIKLWECDVCFNDLCPEGVKIRDTYRFTKIPRILWTEWGQSNFQQFDIYYEWKLPLFCNLPPSDRPAVITLSMVKQRLEELSKGPYEDFIRLTVGPDASFRDEVFLETFDDNGNLRGLGDFRIQGRHPRDAPWSGNGTDDQVEGEWSIEEGDLYLSLSRRFWCASQMFDRDSGHGESSRFYYGEEDSESDGSE